MTAHGILYKKWSNFLLNSTQQKRYNLRAFVTGIHIVQKCLHCIQALDFVNCDVIQLTIMCISEENRFYTTGTHKYAQTKF